MSAFQICHPSGITIGQKTSPELLASIDGVKHSEISSEHSNYAIPPFEVLGRKVGCIVYVKTGAIEMLSMGIDDAELYGEGWKDVTEEKERRRAKDTADLLAELGVPVGNYSWGTVSAGFDVKGFSGGGHVRYSK